MSTSQPSPEMTGVEPGLDLHLPPHLIENFEKADSKLLAAYNASPGVTALIRLWLACATSAEVQREFESAVLDIRSKTLTPPDNGLFDEDCL